MQRSTLIDTLIEYPKLLVAAVNGHAYGMAVSTLPLYDMAFALPNRTFKLPFSEVGVCAEGCSSVVSPLSLSSCPLALAHAPTARRPSLGSWVQH